MPLDGFANIANCRNALIDLLAEYLARIFRI